LLAAAARLGASLAVAARGARALVPRPTERRDLFPHGVASGDPDESSVVLWTRRPDGSVLHAEIALDPDFAHIVATTRCRVSAATDWTCRVLAAGLRPSREYWYRFVDDQGFASRVGRTLTAPAKDDERPVAFVFVSCQNVQQGAQTAYRRMIWDDEHKSPADRIGFVLHLGDFIYEIVWYPEDRPQGMYDRRLRDIVRYEHGEQHSDFHVPTTVDDYRAVYRAYLLDPDLQDARARWPFVYMWDNHEFSWKGWQTQENFGTGVVPAQTRKVAAAQTWFEYQPSRVDYRPPVVRDAPIHEFDANGLGLERENLLVLDNLIFYRALRWGKHVELILTDNRTFRSEPITDQPGMTPFKPAQFPAFNVQDIVDVLDAGRTYDGGHPPATIRFGGADLPNPRRDAPASSMLGAREKQWFFDTLRASTARWKLWGNSVSMIEWRADFANLPPEVGVQWPSTGYGQIANDDWCEFRTERAEILEFVRANKLGGFVSIAGDRHAFLAGLLSKSLPPATFEPVAVEFVVGSISAPTIFEALTYGIPAAFPLRALYLYDPAPGAPVQCALNLTVMHGVRSSLALQRTHDVQQAMAVRNPDVGPHLSHADIGGHGYAIVRATAAALDVEFVCIPRPVEAVAASDGGPLAYRVAHRVPWWDGSTAPTVARTSVDGTLPLVLTSGS
jgi:alkaline phosphatase D